MNGSNVTKSSQITNAAKLAIQKMSKNAILLLIKHNQSYRMVVAANFKPVNNGMLTSTKAKLEIHSTTTIILKTALVVTKL